MIQLPVSKSIGARFMVATYFAGSLPGDPYFEDNDDLMLLQQALLEVYSDEEPIDYGDSPVDVGASGTALRFLTAVCASSPGADYVITGTPRLMERPMEPLVDLLRKAGAGIEILGPHNTGPYRVKGDKLKGGEFEIRGDISSQFISALMLVAPTWEKGIKLYFTTPPVSFPYIRMTADVMTKFGVKPQLSDNSVSVSPASYHDAPEFKIEADWSAASFFYEAAVLGAEGIRIESLLSPKDSIQGDSVCADLFSRLGVVSSFVSDGVAMHFTGEVPQSVEIDFKNCPDLMLPFAVACLASGVKFKLSGVTNLRLKESDRLESLKVEARKLGWVVTLSEDIVEWNGEMCVKEPDPVIDPHEDHRVAMAFAMLALKLGRVRIKNPRVVEKSFINFWNQLPQLGLKCDESENIMNISL